MTLPLSQPDPSFSNHHRLGSMVWVWALLLASLMTCGGILSIQERQNRLISHLMEKQTLLSQARGDLSNGYMNIALGQQPGTPFDHAQGLALLGQARAAMERALRLHGALPTEKSLGEPENTHAEQLATLAQAVEQFRQAVIRRGVQSEIDMAWLTEQRIAFFALEQQAERVALHVDEDLAETMDRYSSYQNMITGSAGLMLGIICLTAFIGDRSRKRTEQRLLASEQRFKLMVETSPLAIYASSDLDQKANYINQTFIRMFGYTIDEVPTATEWWPRAYPDEAYRMEILSAWQSRVERAIKTQTAIEPMETVVTCKDGTQKEVLWGYVSTPSQNYTFGLDLTERKRAEKALLESRERFRLFMDNSPFIAWVKDEQGRHVYLNKTFEARLGLHLGEVFGKTDRELYAPEIAAEYRTNDLAVLKGQIPIEVIETSLDRGHSLSYWLCTKFPFSDAAGKRFVAGIGIDITRRRQAEEALQASEERLRLALEAAKAGTWEWDLRTNENFWSEELFKLYGLPPHSCTPSYETWRKSIHPEDRERTEQAVRDAAGAGVEIIAEWRVGSDEGRNRWLLSKGRPLFDDLGVAIRYIGIVIDITERKEAEKALQASLDEKVALLKEIHHRVKNNLQIVTSLLGLQAGRSGSEEVASMLQETRNRVKAMALLHETLYRSGNLTSIHLPRYIKDLCGQLTVSSSPSGGRVPIEYEVAEVGLPLEHAVPCGLIVSELVTNALKHGFPGNYGGRVKVGLEVGDGRMLVLSVADEGVGIPADFDPRATSTLGLKLVSGLAQQLHGRLASEAAPKGGTVFRVAFPMPEGTTVGTKT